MTRAEPNSPCGADSAVRLAIVSHHAASLRLALNRCRLRAAARSFRLFASAHRAEHVLARVGPTSCKRSGEMGRPQPPTMHSFSRYTLSVGMPTVPLSACARWFPV